MNRTNFYRIITFAISAFLLAACASKAGMEPSLTMKNAVPVAESVAAADDLFRQSENTANLREAVKLLAAARNPDNRNFDVEWKFAKYNYFLGRRTDDEAEADKAFETGLQAARIASRIEPGKPEGHFWYGANLGEQARRSPVTVGIKAVDDIRESMQKVIEIEPSYEGASAYDVLAQVELSTGVFGGKAEKAVEYLEKALLIEKTNANIYLHLAQAYLAVGRKPEARKQLEQVLAMTPNPEYLPEHRETTEKARKMLRTKF